MSNKKSWFDTSNDYFADNRIWRLVGGAIITLLAFLVLWSYLAPARQRNMVLNQSDVLQHKGMSKEILDFRKANDDQEPLWTNSMFGGMPSFQISTWYPNNLMQKLDNILNLRGIAPAPIGNLFILFLGLFLLLIALRADPFSAGVAAFGFMMCSYFFIVIEAGHNSKVNAVAYMPMVLAGVMYLYRGRYWLGGAITILAMGLEVNANHLQITYYGFFAIGLIMVSELVLALRQKRPVTKWIMASGIMALCMGISIAPNLGRLMTNNEYVKETMRGGAVLEPTAEEIAANAKAKEPGLDKKYAYVWSYGISESFTIINPLYFGDAAHSKLDEDSETYDLLKKNFSKQGADQLSAIWPTYMGDQPMHGGPTYMGVVICFLFILGLILVPARYRWWLLGTVVISIMLSWGRNLQWFSDIFFDYFPKYNIFRAPSMWLTITGIGMATMAGLALKSVFKNEGNLSDKDMMKRIGIGAGVTLFVLLFLAFVQPGVTLRFPDEEGRIAGFLAQVGLKNADPGLISQLADAIGEDRSDMITSQAYKGMLIVILAAASLIGFVYIRNQIKDRNNKALLMGAVALGLFALIYWDMAPIDQRYLNKDSFVKQSEYMNIYNPSQADNMIKADKDPDYRVLNLAANIWNDAITSYHHKSIGGYSAAKLRRYQDLIERCYDKEFEILQQAFGVRDSTQMQAIDQALQKTTVLNMMNTKYIIVNPNGGVLPNSHAMGHAWIAGSAEILPKPDDVIAKLQATDLRAKMLVEESSAEPLKGFTPALDTTAKIELTSYKTNELKYAFSSSNGKDQLVTFSEVYYNHGKGWNAYIDGNPVEHFRCDYILRGLRVPGGKHEIVFKMEPHSYYLGETIALVSSILLFLLAAAGIFWDFWTRGKGDDEAVEATPTTDLKV